MVRSPFYVWAAIGRPFFRFAAASVRKSAGLTEKEYRAPLGARICVLQTKDLLFLCVERFLGDETQIQQRLKRFAFRCL